MDVRISTLIDLLSAADRVWHLNTTDPGFARAVVDLRMATHDLRRELQLDVPVKDDS